MYVCITCVRAEHSTYFTALRSRASFSAVSGVMGFCLFLASFSIVEGSSRKSIWVPTRRKGVFGQWWVISGTHWINTTINTPWKLIYRIFRKTDRQCSGPSLRRWPHSHIFKENGTCKTYLFFDIFKGGWRHNRETNEEDICLGITQRS